MNSIKEYDQYLAKLEQQLKGNPSNKETILRKASVHTSWIRKKLATKIM